MMGLTPGQAKVLAVIKRWFAEHGCAPTIEEIKAEFGWTGNGTVYETLRALEVRGAIRRTPCKTRGIELIERPVRYRFIPVSALTWPVAA